MKIIQVKKKEKNNNKKIVLKKTQKNGKFKRSKYIRRKFTS